MSSQHPALDTMNAYMAAFEKADLAEMTKHVHLPITYIAEDHVRTMDRYPFDPVKLKAATGYDHSKVDITVLAADAQKAHTRIVGTRHRADGSVIEHIDAVYILQDRGDGWKIAAFSGVRTAA
tara:strand:+ start:661 stop:1029 length:369 start_codon:yes stop_codon:yes gene_type:complete